MLYSSYDMMQLTDFVVMIDKVKIMLLVKHMKFSICLAEILFFLNMKPDHLAQHDFHCITFINWGTWHSWLMHCATDWNVKRWIPDDVIGIFIDSPSGCTMALRLIEPLTEISIRAYT